ncbi:hypothetical protein BC941DRAFT_195327 [Chlamydoabsidia padenii]|nr:hypothetical protein BC941DRAFT_195327 [Chlamydoabsidia padenii]
MITEMGSLPAVSCRSMERVIGIYAKEMKSGCHPGKNLSNVVEKMAMLNHVQSLEDLQNTRTSDDGSCILRGKLKRLDMFSEDLIEKVKICITRITGITSDTSPNISTAVGMKTSYGFFGAYTPSLTNNRRQAHLVKIVPGTELNPEPVYGSIQNILVIENLMGKNDVYVAVKALKDIEKSLVYPRCNFLDQFHPDVMVFPAHEIICPIGILDHPIGDRKQLIIYKDYTPP